ncbi:MAG: nucleotidyl transferase AbiEii/AbiGii toxin family protein [Bacteroidetes bacterium]|nr:nucleotidyl transferase AbiEii/AbiGii toxin family protein [Bacteroidota bacterium]
MGNIFNDDFKDFIIALNQAKVKYVLIGGYSVIYHGFSRTTGDLDLFVEVSSTNYNCLKDAYTRFGLDLFDMTEFNFLHNEAIDVFSFGRPPVSIDIIKRISLLDFEEVYENSIETIFEEIPMRIIHLNDLKRNKRESGRVKDMYDLENLE